MKTQLERYINYLKYLKMREYITIKKIEELKKKHNIL